VVVARSITSRPELLDGLDHDVGEIHGRAPRGPGFEPGQGQEILDHELQSVDLFELALHQSRRLRVERARREGRLRLQLEDRERRPELVRGVGGELPESQDGSFEPVQHLVEGGPHALRLLIDPLRLRQSLGEILFVNPLRGLANRGERRRGLRRERAGEKGRDQQPERP
jgi:hypothetical protein